MDTTIQRLLSGTYEKGFNQRKAIIESLWSGFPGGVSPCPQLDQRQEWLLKIWYGSTWETRPTLATIGAELGVCVGRVRQIERTAFFKLCRWAVAKRLLKPLEQVRVAI